MKLKNISNIALSGALLLLGAVSISSCADQNDWDVDPAYDRLFHATNLSVTPYDTKVAVNFNTTKNTTGYVVELSTDTLYDDIAQGANANCVIDTIPTAPDTIRGIDAETKYWIRVRGINAEGKSSKWVYYSKYSFKTKSENIISGVDATKNTATISFDKGAQFTEVTCVYTKEDETLDSINVPFTAEQVAAGEIEATGLTPSTRYTAKIYLEKDGVKKLRGSKDFKTSEDLPDGFDEIDFNGNSDLQTVLNDAVAAGKQNVLINFTQGTNYKQEDGANAIVIPKGLKSIVFWGQEGENKPTFHTKGINAESDLTLIRFYNLNLVNEGADADYVVNLSNASIIDNIFMEKCNIRDTRGVVRAQTSFTGTIGTIKINDCVISNIGSYGLIWTKGATQATLKNVEFSNSTINGCTSGGPISTEQENVKISLDHCTVYNCTQLAKSFIDVMKKTSVVPVISNCLFGPANGANGTGTIKGVSTKTSSVSNTFYTSDMLWNKGYELGTKMDVKAADFWTNAENGDFHIKDTYQGLYGTLGDPRWVE